MSDEWSYPVLWIHPSGEFWIKKDHADMHLGDKMTVRRALLTGSQFIDSNLSHWQVIDGEFAGYRPWFSEWPRYMFNRPGNIRFKTDFLGRRSLPEVIDLLCAALDRDIGLMESEREDLKRGVRSANEFADLIRLVEADV